MRHLLAVFLENLGDFLIERREFKRFVEPTIGRKERRVHRVEAFADASEHEDGRIFERSASPFGLDGPGDFPPAHLGHHDVEHHEVGQFLLHELPRGSAVRSFVNGKTEPFHVARDEAEHGRLIVSDDDRERRGSR
jgi:hypothetical protein